MAVIGNPATSVPVNDGCIGHPSPEDWPNNDLGADSMVSSYGNALANIITDSDGNTWYRELDGQEAASLCSFNFGTVGAMQVPCLPPLPASTQLQPRSLLYL